MEWSGTEWDGMVRHGMAWLCIVFSFLPSFLPSFFPFFFKLRVFHAFAFRVLLTTLTNSFAGSSHDAAMSVVVSWAEELDTFAYNVAIK